MNGGLLKSTSRLGLFAAAGLFAGGMAMPSAKAADLGGDCCADLEERVAELEATTARKGNRKMSLTITGQVDRMILWWDDGHSSKAYYGLDNTNSSSRFTLLGEARVSPNIKMGFEIMIEIEAGGTSSKVNQMDEDGKVGGQISGSAAPGTSFNFLSTNDAYFGDARRVAWWLEHKDIGRVTVGRYEAAGVVPTIDLAGIGVFASPTFSVVQGGFYLRGSTGQFYGMKWADIMDPAHAGAQRTELLRYDTPSIMGFIGTASIAEAGDYWGVMLRYAGEFSGFRIAAGFGYERIRDQQTPATLDPTAAFFSGPRPDQDAWGGSLAVLHVPSGLFAQGHWNAYDYGSPFHIASGYHGSTGGLTKADALHWLIQGGISKNWFGYGNTMIYGEYGKAEDFGAEALGRTFVGQTSVTTCPGDNAVCSRTIDNFTAVAGVIGTDVRVWGVGIGQNIDAAASTVYLAYRNYDADVNCNTANCGSATTGATNGKLPTEQFHALIGGAVVRF
jgi:hypothetical protein